MEKTRKTVWIALAANGIIALAKAVAGVASGSAAMLAEAAHSVADTANQGLLLVSLSLGDRAPDEEHPFGHGKERFFWAFLAAVLIFVSGAVFSLAEGGLRLFGVTKGTGTWVANVVVLVVAFVAEGLSLLRAMRQTRDEARDAGMAWREFIRESTDPTAKFVVFEDSAAVAGVVIAFAGVVLSTVTGSESWDGAASIAIGVLLASVAYRLGRDTKDLLIGRAARPEQQQRIRQTILAHGGVDDVVDLRTMYIGPHSMLVAARVDLANLDGDRVEEVASEIARALHEREPDVTEVFLDPTRAGSRDEA